LLDSLLQEIENVDTDCVKVETTALRGVCVLCL